MATLNGTMETVTVLLPSLRCSSCEVLWEESAGRFCWVCGKPANYELVFPLSIEEQADERLAGFGRFIAEQRKERS